MLKNYHIEMMLPNSIEFPKIKKLKNKLPLVPINKCVFKKKKNLLYLSLTTKTNQPHKIKL